jgi:hypothetical protein
MIYCLLDVKQLVPNVTTRTSYPECIANLKLPIDAFYRESRLSVNLVDLHFLLFVNITGNWKNRLAHTRQIIIAEWLSFSGVPKVITDGTHAPPISVKVVGEPNSNNTAPSIGTIAVAIKKTDHATRYPWTPGKYDVVCSAHSDISRTSASQCRDYYGYVIVCAQFSDILDRSQLLT